MVALWKERSQEGGVIKIKQVQTRKEGGPNIALL